MPTESNGGKSNIFQLNLTMPVFSKYYSFDRTKKFGRDNNETRHNIVPPET